MRLNLRPRDAMPPGLPEGDPLPPDDRVVPRVPERSLETLYRGQAQRLLRFFARRAGQDEARDLVHEAFSRLAHAGGGAARIERPEAYLSRIAGNLLRDRAKTAARRSTALHIPAQDVALLAPDQQAALEARDMLNRLEAVMLRLRPRTREIFMAHRIDGYSYAEIAARTGLSTKGVEKHMSRAIAEIDRALGPR
jgi:RNA polymerase sigma-70 factor (ECF subfamily)